MIPNALETFAVADACREAIATRELCLTKISRAIQEAAKNGAFSCIIKQEMDIDLSETRHGKIVSDNLSSAGYSVLFRTHKSYCSNTREFKAYERLYIAWNKSHNES